MPPLPLSGLSETFDIVWCRYPTAELPRAPGPKARPALVRLAFLPRRSGFGVVEVSYGTSQIYGKPPSGLIIAEQEDLVLGGLARPTCFHLERLAFLPWASEFFLCHPGRSTPIIGRLSDRLQAELRAATRR